MVELMWCSLAQTAAEQRNATRIASSCFVGLSRLVSESFDQRSEVPFPQTCKLGQNEAVAEARRALAFARLAADRTNRDAQEAIAGTFGPMVQPQHGPAAYPSRWKEAIDAIHRAHLHAAECFAASGRLSKCLESCTRGIQIDVRAMGLITRSSRMDSHKLRSAIAALALKQCINAGWACSKAPSEGPSIGTKARSQHHHTAQRIQQATLHWTQVLLDSLQEGGPRQWPMQGQATSWCKRAAALPAVPRGARPASSMLAACEHRAGTGASGREFPSSSGTCGGTQRIILQRSPQGAAPVSRTSTRAKTSTVAGAETAPADEMKRLASEVLRKGDHSKRIACIMQHSEGTLACAWLIWHTSKVRALRPLRVELLAHMVLAGRKGVSGIPVILCKQLAADLGAAGDYDRAYRVYRCSAQMELTNMGQTRQRLTDGPASSSSSWLPYSAAELEALRTKFQQRTRHSSDFETGTKRSSQRFASPLEQPEAARSATTAVPVPAGREPGPQHSIADLMQELKSIEAAESKAMDTTTSELVRVMDELTPAAAPSSMEARQRQRTAVSFRQALSLRPDPQAGTLDASTHKDYRPTDLLGGEMASKVATVLPPGVNDAALERSRQADADAAVSNLAALRAQQRLLHTARASTGEVPVARHSSPRSRQAVPSRGSERFGFSSSSFRFSRDTAAARTQHEQLKQVRHTWNITGNASPQQLEPSPEALQSGTWAHVGTVGAGTLPQPAAARLRTLPRVPGAVMGQAPVRLGDETARGIDTLIRQISDHSDHSGTQTRLDVTSAFSAGQSPLSTKRAAHRASMPRSTRPGRELAGLEVDCGRGNRSAPALRLKGLVDGRRSGIAEWRAEVGRLCDAARERQARGDLHNRPTTGRPSRLAQTRTLTGSVTRGVVDPVKVRQALAFQELVARNTLGDTQ